MNYGQDDEEEALIPPENFALVESCGIYRSGFPGKKNFPFLRTLNLRTVLYLCPEEYPPANLAFLTAQHVQLLQFGVAGNKEPFVEIPHDIISEALVQLLDTRNHPLLIHCIAEGTAVNLADGRAVPIEQVKVGSRVLSYSGAESGLVPREVEAVLNQGERPCLELSFSNGSRLVCTAEHEILQADGSWCQARHLLPGTSTVIAGVRYPMHGAAQDAVHHASRKETAVPSSGARVHKDSQALPTLRTKLLAVRSIGVRRVFDLVVPAADEREQSFVANGIVVHNCNKGKHRTGCLVGVLRRVLGWSLAAVFEEYRMFSRPKERFGDQQFIECWQMCLPESHSERRGQQKAEEVAAAAGNVLLLTTGEGATTGDAAADAGAPSSVAAPAAPLPDDKAAYLVNPEANEHLLRRGREKELKAAAAALAAAQAAAAAAAREPPATTSHASLHHHQHGQSLLVRAPLQAPNMSVAAPPSLPASGNGAAKAFARHQHAQSQPNLLSMAPP